MTGPPWDPAEIGTHDSELDDVAGRLTRYADAASEAPSAGLVRRIQSALDDEAIPATAWWRGGGLAARRAPVRMFAAAAALVVGVVAGLALGQLSGLVQDGGTGSSPAPLTSPSPRPSDTPSPTISPSLSPSPSPSPTSTSSPVSSARLITPRPAATADDRTPDPDDSGGNSGPGGGGDNSGPGGGDSP